MKNRFMQVTKLERTWPLHLLMLPGVALLIVFSYLPMVGISLAFQDYLPGRGFLGSDWVGLRNFRYLFALPDIKNVVRNTVLISLGKIALTTLTSIVVALMINEVRRKLVARTVQTVLLFPYFLSWVILSGIFVDVFSLKGGLNQVLVRLFSIEPIFFMGDKPWFLVMLLLTHVWKDMGYTMVIYLAAMTSIDVQMYESAMIDGASRWKQTRYITLPSIAPIIVLTLILALGSVLSAGFDQIFTMYNTLVIDVADIVDTYVYRLGLRSAQYSLATAVGLLKSAVSMVLVVASYWAAGRFAGYKVF